MACAAARQGDFPIPKLDTGWTWTQRPLHGWLHPARLHILGKTCELEYVATRTPIVKLIILFLCITNGPRPVILSRVLNDWRTLFN